MPHLGDFTAARAEQTAEPVTFDFHGQTFTVADQLSQMALMDFGRIAVTDVDANAIEGLAALHDVYESLLTEEDWPRFKALAKKERVSGDELNELLRLLMEAMSGRPTSRPSDSSDGPSPTGENSKGDFSSPEARKRLGLVPVNELLSSAL